MLSGVTPQLFINLSPQSYFFSQVVLGPYQGRGGLSSGPRCTVAEQEETETALLSLYFLLKAILSNILYHPPCFIAPAKVRITLKSPGCLSHHRHQTGLAFLGPVATQRGVPAARWLPPVPDQTGASERAEVCSLTHPPVIPCLGWIWQATVCQPLASHLVCALVSGQVFSGRFIRQLGSKISELREIPHREFISFSCF